MGDFGDFDDGNEESMFDVSEQKMSNAEASSFMRKNFFGKECSKYVVKRKQKLSLDDVAGSCYCGGTSQDHDLSFLQTNCDDDPDSWSESDITKFPTNAFGKIYFGRPDKFQQPAKYVRLDDDSDLNDVLDLIEHYWNLTKRKPELVISVMGSGKAFNITSSLKKKIFNKGLIPAIEATRGWITTYGINIGVANAVGEAVKEGQYFCEENSRVGRSIQCIGIAPWGVIRDRKLLINTTKAITDEEVNQVQYPIDTMVRQKNKPTPLNPYHTHFLLVDDGHRNKERGVAQFRARLEQKISAPTDEGGLNIPVVCILIEGGVTSIEYLAHSVSQGLPLLVCEGSGRAADIVAYAYRHYKLCRMNRTGEINEGDLTKLRSDVRQKLEKCFYPDGVNFRVSKRVDVLIHELLQICEKPDLVYLFDVNRKENLDTAILLCLLECRSLDPNSQLHLALHWNRADVAKAKIFSSDIHWNHEDLCGHFTEALIGEKLDFIKLFVDHGFSVKRYLTVVQLRKIYALSIDDSTFMWHLLKFDVRGVMSTNEVYLVEIYNVLKQLTNRFSHPEYFYDTEFGGRDMYTFDKPFQELFLWATLLNKMRLAMYFWEQCSEPLLTILGGTFICSCLSEKAHSFNAQLEEASLSAKEIFECNAVGLIDQYFGSNKEKAIALISIKSKVWGNLNCMELAAIANDKDFLASACCQTVIFQTWKNGYEASGWEILFCTFTILPIFRMVQFSEEAIHYHSSGQRHNGRLCDYNETYVQTHHFSIPNPRRSSSPSIHYYKISRASHDKKKSIRSHYAIDAVYSVCHRKKLKWWEKLYKFYTSPVVKFTNNVLWYILYLMLHSYVLLFSFRWPEMTVPELVLHVWMLTFFCELIRAIITYPATTVFNKFGDWWYYSSFAIWNRLEMLCIFVSFFVFLFRWFATTFAVARLLLAVNFILSMFRVYKIFMVNSDLGPKVVMIKRMSTDLFMFLLLVGVAMISYSVASQALLHPHRSFYSGIFFDTFVHGSWELFGELNDEITHGNLPPCESPINETLFGITTDCSFRIWPAAILLVLYLFFGNILLVNMLIAIFASIFDDVQSHSEQIWKSLMYFLVTEYDKKPVLPPPFIVFEHFAYMLRFCFFARRKEVYDSNTHADNFKFLNVFELVCRSDYLEKQKQDDQKPNEMLLVQINENILKLQRILAEVATRKAAAAASALPPPNSVANRRSMAPSPTAFLGKSDHLEEVSSDQGSGAEDEEGVVAGDAPESILYH